MQLDLRHAAEQNAKRYRENLSYLRGYEAAANAGRSLPAKYVEKAGWVWAVERVRADLKAKDPEKERFFARLYHLDEPCPGTPGRGCEITKLSLELCGDITETGICLSGGSAQLYGLDKFISEQTGVPCYVAEDPASCVAIGAGRVLEDLRLYKNVIYDYRRGDYYEA